MIELLYIPFAVIGSELDLAKVLIGGGAGAGTFAFFAWIFYRNYTTRVDADIDYLKKQSDDCRQDREELHREIREMQRGIITKAIDAMTANEQAMVANTEALQRLFQKLDKKD